ncbi:hypothetical protein AgCh_022162 [Apium graveolens]
MKGKDTSIRMWKAVMPERLRERDERHARIKAEKKEREWRYAKEIEMFEQRFKRLVRFGENPSSKKRQRKFGSSRRRLVHPFRSQVCETFLEGGGTPVHSTELPGVGGSKGVSEKEGTDEYNHMVSGGEDGRVERIIRDLDMGDK